MLDMVAGRNSELEAQSRAAALTATEGQSLILSGPQLKSVLGDFLGLCLLVHWAERAGLTHPFHSLGLPYPRFEINGCSLKKTVTYGIA